MNTRRRWLLGVSAFLVLIGLLLAFRLFLYPRNLGVTRLAFWAIKPGMSDYDAKTIISDPFGGLPYPIESNLELFDVHQNEFHEAWKGRDGSAIRLYFRRRSPDSDFYVYQKEFFPSTFPLWARIQLIFSPPRPVPPYAAFPPGTSGPPPTPPGTSMTGGIKPSR
jgi:hypothetical protein